MDLKTFSKGRLSGDLARQILEALAIETQPEAHVIAKKIGVDTRRAQNHIDALKDLFLLREVSPHPDAEKGKAQYYLFDSGLVHHLGGSLMKRFESYFLTEYFFHAQNIGNRRDTRLHYFKTRGGLNVNFLTKDRAFFFSDDNHLSKNSLKSIQAAQKRLKKHKTLIYLNSGQNMSGANTQMQLIPWTEVSHSF
jgi:predicted AAA+ superfamily ATPase